MLAGRIEMELQCFHDAHIGLARIANLLQKSTFMKTNLRKLCLKMPRALLRLSAVTTAPLISEKALAFMNLESQTICLCR